MYRKLELFVRYAKQMKDVDDIILSMINDNLKSKGPKLST